MFHLHTSVAQKTIYEYIHSKLEHDDEEDGQLVFACDVTADEECSRKLKVCDHAGFHIG